MVCYVLIFCVIAWLLNFKGSQECGKTTPCAVNTFTLLHGTAVHTLVVNQSLSPWVDGSQPYMLLHSCLPLSLLFLFIVVMATTVLQLQREKAREWVFILDTWFIGWFFGLKSWGWIFTSDPFFFLNYLVCMLYFMQFCLEKNFYNALVIFQLLSYMLFFL